MTLEQSAHAYWCASQELRRPGLGIGAPAACRALVTLAQRNNALLGMRARQALRDLGLDGVERLVEPPSDVGA